MGPVSNVRGVRQLGASRPIGVVAALIAACLLFAACTSSRQDASSSSGPESSAIEKPGISASAALTSAPVPTVPSSLSAASGRTFTFDYTDPDGWTYSSSQPIPSATFTASSDISSAPPGYANLMASLMVSPEIGQVDLADTNPGRPGGPTLSIYPGTLVFPVTPGVVDKLDSSMLDKSGDASIGNPEFGACALYPPYGDNGSYWWPGGSAIYCQPQTGRGVTQFPGAESIVAELVRALTNVRPIYVINYTGSSSCNIAIYPSDRVQYAPGYGANCPGKIGVEVAR